MKIVISHLTRMQKGCICVAGVDIDSGRHVRPVMRQQMPVDMLAAHGGPFAMGAIVELGRDTPRRQTAGGGGSTVLCP